MKIVVQGDHWNRMLDTLNKCKQPSRSSYETTWHFGERRHDFGDLIGVLSDSKCGQVWFYKAAWNVSVVFGAPAKVCGGVNFGLLQGELEKTTAASQVICEWFNPPDGTVEITAVGKKSFKSPRRNVHASEHDSDTIRVLLDLAVRDYPTGEYDTAYSPEGFLRLAAQALKSKCSCRPHRPYGLYVLSDGRLAAITNHRAAIGKPSPGLRSVAAKSIPVAADPKADYFLWGNNVVLLMGSLGDRILTPRLKTSPDSDKFASLCLVAEGVATSGLGGMVDVPIRVSDQVPLTELKWMSPDYWRTGRTPRMYGSVGVAHLKEAVWELMKVSGDIKTFSGGDGHSIRVVVEGHPNLIRLTLYSPDHTVLGARTVPSNMRFPQWESKTGPGLVFLNLEDLEMICNAGESLQETEVQFFVQDSPMVPYRVDFLKTGQYVVLMPCDIEQGNPAWQKQFEVLGTIPEDSL